jgi:hypothetical protein
MITWEGVGPLTAANRMHGGNRRETISSIATTISSVAHILAARSSPRLRDVAGILTTTNCDPADAPAVLTSRRFNRHYTPTRPSPSDSDVRSSLHTNDTGKGG